MRPSPCRQRCGRAHGSGDFGLQGVRPDHPAEHLGRAKGGKPAADQQLAQRPRFLSSNSTGSPAEPMRARERDAWISISATSP